MDLNRYADAPLTYSEVGATRGELPSGYHHVQVVREIGSGKATFEAAANAILDWAMHRGVGIRVESSTPTAQDGTVFFGRLGLGPASFIVPCRVVYTIDEPNRRGFAYGTLAGHPECGEELFAVEYRPEDESVHVTIAAFSRPGRWFTRISRPVSHTVQRFMTEQYFRAIIRNVNPHATS